METHKPHIDAIYYQTNPNQPIDLGNVSVTFVHKARSYSGLASVKMHFTPGDRLIFSVQHNDDQLSPIALAFDESWDGKMVLTDRQVSIDVLWHGRGSKEGTIAFIPKKSGCSVTSPSGELVDATFHLFNFPDFWSQDSRLENMANKWFILRADGWVITVTATSKTKEVCAALEEDGGFVITHLGKVKREDGSTFSSNNLEDLLQCIHYFLSFALGRWAGLALPVGFDRNRKRLFEQWGTRMMAPGLWNGGESWFDAHHAQLLSEVFPGFMARWKDQRWNDAFQKSIYWYLAANETRIGAGIAVDTGIILAQAALELLAWTYCTQDRKMDSPKAFKSRSAANKFRLLSSALGIPLALPSQLSVLQAEAEFKGKDAMDVITIIRNSLVHPDAQMHDTHDYYYETWKLFLWYLDMILLRLCDHQGNYANRLSSQGRLVGTVEPVPWAKAVTQ